MNLESFKNKVLQTLAQIGIDVKSKANDSEVVKDVLDSQGNSLKTGNTVNLPEFSGGEIDETNILHKTGDEAKTGSLEIKGVFTVRENYNNSFVGPLLSGGVQGYTFDGANHYIFSNYNIKKYDADWQLIAENTSLVNSVTNANHIGDGVHFDGKIYVPVEYYGSCADNSNQTICVIGTDLVSIDSYDISAQGHETSSIATDGQYLYITSFCDGFIYKYSLAGVYQGSIETGIIGMQGITVGNGLFYISDESSVYKVSFNGSEVQQILEAPSEYFHASQGIQYTSNQLRWLIKDDEVNNVFYYDVVNGEVNVPEPFKLTHAINKGYLETSVSKLPRKEIEVGDFEHGSMNLSGSNSTDATSRLRTVDLGIPVDSPCVLSCNIKHPYRWAVRYGSSEGNLTGDSGWLLEGTTFELPASDSVIRVAISKVDNSYLTPEEMSDFVLAREGFVTEEHIKGTARTYTEKQTFEEIEVPEATEDTHAVNLGQVKSLAGRTEKLISNTTQYTILAEDVDKILKFTANAGEEIQLIYNENTLPDVNKSIVAMSTGDNYLIPTVGTEEVEGTVTIKPTKGSLLKTIGEGSLITLHPKGSVNDLAVWGNLEGEASAEQEFGREPKHVISSDYPAINSDKNKNLVLLQGNRNVVINDGVFEAGDVVWITNPDVDATATIEPVGLQYPTEGKTLTIKPAGVVKVYFVNASSIIQSGDLVEEFQIRQSPDGTLWKVSVDNSGNEVIAPL